MYPSTPAQSANNYLSNRPFIPQTPASINSDIDTSNTANSISVTSIQQNDPRRNIIHQLALLLHAHKCLQRERQALACNGDNHGTTTTSSNVCTLPHCTTMRTVLQHMTKCADFKNCSCKLYKIIFDILVQLSVLYKIRYYIRLELKRVIEPNFFRVMMRLEMGTIHRFQN
jgi:hypothetical protein